MGSVFPEITLVRHGETEWSASGKHTGRSDIPLTIKGEEAARRLGERLRDRNFTAVWSSPSMRARRTAELAGFGAAAEVKPDLAEWDYGAYEGLKTAEILSERPGWSLFRDGCPNGESVAEAGARADRMVIALRAVAGDVLVFSSAHFLRMLTARWLGLTPADGALFVLDTASLSVLGYEHDMSEPVLRRWNVV